MSRRMRMLGADPSPTDLAKIPELTDTELDRMYRPVKRPISLRVDADVLAWLKSTEKPYQTRINAILRAAMLRERSAGTTSVQAVKTRNRAAKH